MAAKPMYSAAWFDTFAASVPESHTLAEVAGIAAIAPHAAFPRLIELGCGSGRVTGPLTAHGYQVTGIDSSVEALLKAQREAPGPWYVALDQRHVGRMRWTFDVAVVLWNSFGFASREADAETLLGLASVVRPGGRIILDLYHPGWLLKNQQRGHQDSRGATINRWVDKGRCFHQILYPNGSIDSIQFNVYLPDEIGRLAERAGLKPQAYSVWWNPEMQPDAEFARYQLVCVRPE